MKRATLIRNLQSVMDNLPNFHLPVTIEVIYSYGSILREKENPGDIDLIIYYTQTKQQLNEWSLYSASFESDVGTFLRRTVFGKVKGFRFVGGFKRGKSPLDSIDSLSNFQENNCLVWSREKPNVQLNINGRTRTEKTSHNAKELDRLLIDEIPKYECRFAEAKKRALATASYMGIKIDVKALEHAHVKIVRTGLETSKEIAEKVEQARTEMKKYDAEKEILGEISIFSVRSDEYSKEKYLARAILKRSNALGLLEVETRRILRTLGLPEDYIVIIEKHGSTEYKIARNLEERDKMLVEGSVEKQHKRLRDSIQTAINSVDRRAGVDLVYFENNRPKELRIVYDRPQNEEQSRALQHELRQKGFTIIEKPESAYIAFKSKCLHGTETIRELQGIARALLSCTVA